MGSHPTLNIRLFFLLPFLVPFVWEGGGLRGVWSDLTSLIFPPWPLGDMVSN